MSSFFKIFQSLFPLFFQNQSTTILVPESRLWTKYQNPIKFQSLFNCVSGAQISSDPYSQVWPSLSKSRPDILTRKKKFVYFWGRKIRRKKRKKWEGREGRHLILLQLAFLGIDEKSGDSPTSGCTSCPSLTSESHRILASLSQQISLSHGATYLLSSYPHDADQVKNLPQQKSDCGTFIAVFGIANSSKTEYKLEKLGDTLFKLSPFVRFFPASWSYS